MHLFYGGLFWGLLLVVLGISMVLKAIFKINIPLFRILFAILLIYFGVRMLLGNRGTSSNNKHTVLSESYLENITEGTNIDVIFGKSEINLNNIDLKLEDAKVNVDVIFGSAEVSIKPEIPARIKINTVFAEC